MLFIHIMVKKKKYVSGVGWVSDKITGELVYIYKYDDEK